MSTQSLLSILNDAENSARGVEMEFRLDFSDLILKGLERKQWTQKELAAASRISEPMLTSIIHAERNFTASTLGRLLFALAMRAKLVEFPAVDCATIETNTDSQYHAEMVMTDGQEDKENFQIQQWTQTPDLESYRTYAQSG
jgi:transcriptional regulator with XRE-family HTH domain